MGKHSLLIPSNRFVVLGRQEKPVIGYGRQKTRVCERNIDAAQRPDSDTLSAYYPR